MAKSIHIKKGLDLRIQGQAPLSLLSATPMGESYAVVPDDFVGLVPKLSVHVGDRVEAGDALLYDKSHPEIKIVSPVSGEVIAIHRGEKRKILDVEVKPDTSLEDIRYKEFDVRTEKISNKDSLLALLLESGMFSFFKQRPYHRLADPKKTPRDIFVTAHFSAPLAPSFDFVLENRAEDLIFALEALKKLTPGKVYLGMAPSSVLPQVEGVEYVTLEGPHPVGNVGVMINHLAPVNKGEVVWTLKASDLLVIGRLLRTGKADFTRRVVIAGSEALEKGYADVLPGGRIMNQRALFNKDNYVRVVAGDPLTGVKIDESRPFLSWDCDQITLLPEGDRCNELFGWIMPRFDQYSRSRSYFSWLTPKREFRFDTRVKGGERAMIMSHELSSVFPMDIYPEYLIKAIIAFDIDKMEQLGIYEVAPEDFALCEFLDTSKMELQQIVRRGLDLLFKEMN